MRAPFPWYGGKSRAAAQVWRAFGNVPNYVEPFAGSMAVLLARPHEAKVETVNDLDGLIANFWRATQIDPDQVARWADWPVNEADLHARHQWLTDRAPSLYEQLVADPEYFDAKVAGWWVWGVSQWQGSWCTDSKPGRFRRTPKLSQRGHGIHVHTDLAGLFRDISARLRNVRVCCGDWARVVTPSVLGVGTRIGSGMDPCGVLLDPPYAFTTERQQLYREDDDGALSASVRAWAIENGDNQALRIALCGWEGEHEMPSSWRCGSWKPQNGFANRDRERIWLSPHCLEVERQPSLPGIQGGHAA